MMSMPTGYVLDQQEMEKMSTSGHEVWIKDQNIVVFFHKVHPKILSFNNSWKMNNCFGFHTIEFEIKLSVTV